MYKMPTTQQEVGETNRLPAPNSSEVKIVVSSRNGFNRAIAHNFSRQQIYSNIN